MQVKQVSLLLLRIEPPGSSLYTQLKFFVLGHIFKALSVAAAWFLWIANLIQSVANKNGTTSRRHSPIHRILGSGNILRHFSLEFTMEDGSVYTMEKLTSGPVLYLGTTRRKEHQYTSVWKIPLNESTLKGSNHVPKKVLTVSDLERIVKEEQPIKYTYLGANCKRFAWSVLKRLVKPELMAEFEYQHLSHDQAASKQPLVTTAAPAGSCSRRSLLRSSSRYSVFRDCCQLVDRKAIAALSR